MSKIKLIVGLGNPGTEYAGTRHNAGTDFVTELARCHNIELKPESKFFGITGRGLIAGQDIRLLIPTTFMNLSGKAVAAIAMICGYAIIAVPTGIIGAELMQEFQHRNNPSNSRKVQCTHCNAEHHQTDAVFCRICGGLLDKDK